MVMNPLTKEISSKRFDTWADAKTQIPAMNKYIDDIPFGSIVAVAVRDAQYKNGGDLTKEIEDSRSGLDSLGGGRAGCPYGVFRDAFALITMKVANLDNLPSWFTCELKPTKSGSAIVTAVIPTDVDECTSGSVNPCKNGGECTNQLSYPGQPGFTCKCADGWEGSTCETVTATKVEPRKYVSDPFANLRIPSALRCYECQSSVSNQDCIRRGKLATCQSNQGSCQNTVRINHGRLQISKGCKQTQACENNLRQNRIGRVTNTKNEKWGVHAQCSFSWQQTTCRCCCSSDKCNSRPLYCVSDTVQAKVATLSKRQEPVKVEKIKSTGQRNLQPATNNARDSHPCTYNPCGNGAECIRLPAQRYSCKCRPGWRDSHCNTPMSRRDRARARWIAGRATAKARMQEIKSEFMALLG